MFRGRIRHLRKANVAGLPQTGTGRQITYTLEHVRLIYIALRLNRMGMLPEVIGRYLDSQRREVAGWFEAASASPERTLRAAMSLATFGGEAGEGLLTSSSLSGWDDGARPFDALLQAQGWKDRAVPYIVLNVSAAERLLRDCLAKAAPAL